MVALRALVILSLLSGPALAVETTVTLDGQALPLDCLSLNGTPDAPVAGDLVRVDEVWIRLGAPGALELRKVKRPWGHLILEGTPGKIVAAYVGEETADPLSELTDEEARGLRGLHLRYPPADLGATLSRIDPKQCALELFYYLAVGDERAVPDLPPDLQCLVLHTGMSDGFAEFSALECLTDLRALRMDSMLDLPGRTLNCLGELRALHAKVVEFDPVAVAGLTRLRTLEIRFSDTVDRLDFVRRLRELKVLDVSSTAITDVSPLAGHGAITRLGIRHTRVRSLRPLSGHPTLRRVDATCSLLTLLPVGEPGALELVTALQASVPDAEAAAFRARYPECTLHCRYLEPLFEAVAPTTRLRLRDGGMCHRSNAPGEKTLYETEDAEEIREFVEGLEVFDVSSEEGYFGKCGCCGSMTLEFWAGERFLTGVSIHHQSALRWHGWVSDADLTEKGAEFLLAWIEKRTLE